MDLMAYMKNHLPLLECTPFGARTSTALELTFLKQEFQSGAIFCLKDMSGKALVEAGYSLAPYYLVFVAYDDSIQLNLNQPKQVLDVLKKECVGFTTPQAAAIARFNQRTQSGRNMCHYQELLKKAVVAIVGKEQEQGIQTLSQRGGIRLAGDADGRIDDFEVVAFIALMEDIDRG
mgnify:CR=1 FL=1